MKNFTEFWDATVRKNPHLADASAKIIISVEMYEAALRQAFEFGAREARSTGKPDLFNMFRGK